jgi:hypothetical protein
MAVAVRRPVLEDRPVTLSTDTTPTSRLRVRHLWLLLPFLGLAFRAVTPIRDNSFLWHIRAGELQLDIGEVLQTDPFSFTELGSSWRTQSWLIELLYGWLFSLTGGVQWVPAMIFIILGTAFGFLGLAVYRWTRDPLSTAIALLVMTWVAFFFAVPRPVLASFLLIAATVVVLQNADRVGWALIPILWLWAAVHGSWVLGGGLIVLEAVRRRSWRLVEIGAVGGVATLFTAHGIGTWEIFVSFLRNRDALSYLSEWARPDFTDPLLAPALLVVVGIVFGAVTGRLERSHLVVIVPFAVFGALQLRSVFPALLVLLPYAAAVRSPRSPVGIRAAQGSTLINKGIAAALVALVVIALARPVLIDDHKLPPVAAVDMLDDRPVLHGPAAGGYLIYAQWPERLVFVDDRAELFGADGFEAVVQALEARDYQALLLRHDIGQALLEAEWPLVAALQADGWETRYEDENWVVLSNEE